MEWLTCVRAAIDYMEAHLQDDISAQDIAERVYVSPFFLHNSTRKRAVVFCPDRAVFRRGAAAPAGSQLAGCEKRAY